MVIVLLLGAVSSEFHTVLVELSIVHLYYIICAGLSTDNL